MSGDLSCHLWQLCCKDSIIVHDKIKSCTDFNPSGIFFTQNFIQYCTLTQGLIYISCHPQCPLVDTVTSLTCYTIHKHSGITTRTQTKTQGVAYYIVQCFIPSLRRKVQTPSSKMKKLPEEKAPALPRR